MRYLQSVTAHLIKCAPGTERKVWLMESCRVWVEVQSLAGSLAVDNNLKIGHPVINCFHKTG